MDGHSSKPRGGRYDESAENENTNLTLEENVEWDGSDSEFIEDEDAEKFEDKYSGVKLCYSLSKEEIKESLKILKDRLRYSRIYSSKRGNIIKTAILAFAFLIFIISYFMGYGIFNLIMSVVCLLVVGVMWYVPLLRWKRIFSENMFKGSYDVKIYPDEVEVETVNGRKKARLVIPMDEKSEFAEIEDMLVIITPNGKVLSIPIRAIEPSVIADVQGILFTGTRPMKD